MPWWLKRKNLPQRLNGTKKHKEKVKVKIFHILLNINFIMNNLKNINSEELLLGYMMINKHCCAYAVNNMKENYFYSQTNKKVFSIMTDMFEKQIPVTINSVSDYLLAENLLNKIGGKFFLVSLAEKTDVDIDFMAEIKTIKDRWIARQLVKLSESTIADCQEEHYSPEILIEIIERKIAELSNYITKTNFVKVKDTMLDTVEHIEELSKNCDSLYANFFDKFKGGNLVVLASHSIDATRDFAMKIIGDITDKNEEDVAIFSMAKTMRQLNLNLLSSYFKIEKKKLKTGNLSDENWKQFCKAGNLLKNLSITYDCTKHLTPTKLRAKCLKLKTKFPDLKMVVIDYLQLLSYNLNNSEKEMEYISKSLKKNAKELDLTFITLSTLKPPSDKTNQPKLSELGIIEKSADIVMLLHNPENAKSNSQGETPAKINIAKNKNGKTKTIKLKYTKT